MLECQQGGPSYHVQEKKVCYFGGKKKFFFGKLTKKSDRAIQTISIAFWITY